MIDASQAPLRSAVSASALPDDPEVDDRQPGGGVDRVQAYEGGIPEAPAACMTESGEDR